MAQLLNHDAAEQTQSRKPLLAFDAGGIPERLARPQQQFAFDRLRVRALVAHDDDVVHDHLLPFGNRKPDVGARTVIRQRHVGLDDHIFVAAVAILDINAIAGGNHVTLRIRPALLGCHQLVEFCARQHRVAHEGDRRHQRSWSFGDGEVEHDPTVRTTGFVTRRLPDAVLDDCARETARPVQIANGDRSAIHRSLNEGLPALDLHELLEIGRRNHTVAGDRDAFDHKTHSTIDRKGDGEHSVALCAGMLRHRVAVAPCPQVVLNRESRVLKEVLVCRPFGANRHEPLAVRFRERIAGKFDRDKRTTVDGDTHGRRPVRIERHSCGRHALHRSP